MGLRSIMKNERAKMSDMSWKEKFQYLWDYYKFVMIGLVIVVFVLMLLLNESYQSIKKNVITVAMVDMTVTSPTVRSMEKGFGKYYDINGLFEKMTFYTNLTEKDDDGSDFVVSFSGTYNQRKLQTHIDTGELDIVISSYEVITSNRESMIKLSDVLSEELYSQLEDNIQGSSSTACGIDISNTKLGKKLGKDVYLGIPSSSNHKDAAVEFIKYVFGIK